MELRWCSEVLKSLLVVSLFFNVVESDSFFFSAALDQLGRLSVRLSLLRDSFEVELYFKYFV